MKFEVTDTIKNNWRAFKLEDGSYADLLIIKDDGKYLASVDIPERRTIRFFNTPRSFRPVRDDHIAKEYLITKRKHDKRLCFKTLGLTHETDLVITDSSGRQVLGFLRIVRGTTIEFYGLAPKLTIEPGQEGELYEN